MDLPKENPFPSIDSWDILPRGLRSEKRILGLILIVAAILRIVSGLAACVLMHDGSAFTLRSRYMDHGDFESALGFWPQMPPLFPLLISLFFHLLRGW